MFGIVFGTYIAWKGLQSWKDQLKGNDRYSLSKKLMLNLYLLKEQIQALRNPRIHENENINSSIHQKPPHFLQERWNSLSEILAENRLIELEIRVIFKRDLEKLFSELDKLLKDLADNIHGYLTAISDPQEYNKEDQIKYYRIIFGSKESKEEDSITVRFEELIGKFEDSVKRFI